MKRIYLLISLLATLQFCFSQTFKINEKGDTINYIDAQNMKQGRWEEPEPANGIVAKGIYINNKKEREWVTYNPNPNGRIIKIEHYVNGLKEGLCLTLNESGIYIKEEYYKNGLKEGLCKNYDTWDLKDETNYKQGKLNGVKKVYYTNEAKSYAPNVTNIQEETFYINDLREGVTKWYSKNDKLAVEYNYHNGLLEGVQKTYFDDGKNVQIEELYKNNIPIEYKEYYRSGKIKTEGKYNSNGQKHGEWKNYSEDGKLLKPTRFIDGNEIKK